LGIVLVIATLVAIVINESAFFFQRESYDRAPKTIEMVIPAGTAARVAAGEAPVGLPSEMTFVVGDVLKVKNEDSSAHELGPLVVPPGTTASLVMQTVDNLAYSCSFQPDGYLGLDVRKATTLGTRLIGLSLTAPTLGALMFLYSLVVFPVGQKKK
jgi:hypothetical protein